MKISNDKVSFIKSQFPGLELEFQIRTNFGSQKDQYREKIRYFMAHEYLAHFTPEQLKKTLDLGHRPQASVGFFSISHCKEMGGFSYSNQPHGFDMEQTQRITPPIITRVSTLAEQKQVSQSENLWVAKEAAFKALANDRTDFVMTDLICENWKSHTETGVSSFRITSEKTLATALNSGFVFSEEDILLAIYFK